MAKEEIGLERLCFLLVDPNDFMRKMVVQILRAMGASNIHQATNGKDGIELLDRHKPDILLTELEMEPVDGIELLRWVRTSDKCLNHYLPVIVVTSYSTLPNVVRARDAGVTEVVIKPLSAKTLFGRINEVIHRPRPFVTSDKFIGPDRRRRITGFQGVDKRGKGGEEIKPQRPVLPSDRSLTQEEADAIIAPSLHSEDDHEKSEIKAS